MAAFKARTRGPDNSFADRPKYLKKKLDIYLAEFAVILRKIYRAIVPRPLCPSVRPAKHRPFH